MAASNAKFCSKENGFYYFDQINEVLNAGNRIEEVDIIPCIKPEGGSCPFILDENKIGIFSWCVKDIFLFAYGQMMQAGKSHCEMTEPEGTHLMELSRVVLLLHSEDYTIWNLRKCCITRFEKYATFELDFCALVLRKNPRSAEAFSHRRWLINLLCKTNKQILETQQFLLEELDICLQCAERYRDNYITWDQRCWLVEHFMFDQVLWLEEELNTTKEWLWTHVSDNCVYHFRQHVLRKLTKLASSSIKIKEPLLGEFKLIDEILKHYPVFETVWYHRRFLINFWSSMFLPCHSCLKIWQKNLNRCEETKNNLNKSILKNIEEEQEEIQYECCKACQKLNKDETISIQNEMELCRQMIVATDDVYSKAARQSELAVSHLNWLGHLCKKLLEITSK